MLGTFTKGFLLSFLIEVTQGNTNLHSFIFHKQKRTPQPRDSQAVSRKIRLYQNRYINTEYQQTGAKLKYAENFRFCQKSITILEHFALVRVLRICYTVQEQSCYRVADL